MRLEVEETKGMVTKLVVSGSPFSRERQLINWICILRDLLEMATGFCGQAAERPHTYEWFDAAVNPEIKSKRQNYFFGLGGNLNFK